MQGTGIQYACHTQFTHIKMHKHAYTYMQSFPMFVSLITWLRNTICEAYAVAIIAMYVAIAM